MQGDGVTSGTGLAGVAVDSGLGRGRAQTYSRVGAHWGMDAQETVPGDF